MNRIVAWSEGEVPHFFYSWERLQYESGELDSWISQRFSTTGKKTGKQSKKCYRREKSPKSKPYDNDYFFLFFVMLFCSFLALTVFLGYSGSKKPFQRKIFTESSMKVSTEKRMWPSTVEKYYFEDECILWTLK